MQEVFKVAHIGLLESDIIYVPINVIKALVSHLWK